MNTTGQRTLFNPNLEGTQFQEHTQYMYFRHASLQSSTGRLCHKYITSVIFCIFIFKSTQVKRLKKCIFICQLIFFFLKLFLLFNPIHSIMPSCAHLFKNNILILLVKTVLTSLTEQYVYRWH